MKTKIFLKYYKRTPRYESARLNFELKLKSRFVDALEKENLSDAPVSLPNHCSTGLKSETLARPAFDALSRSQCSDRNGLCFAIPRRDDGMTGQERATKVQYVSNSPPDPSLLFPP